MGNESTNKPKKRLFWIDKKIDNFSNKIFYDQYLRINFDAQKFNVLNDAIEELLRIKHFSSVIVIISAQLYIDFYIKINKKKEKINFNINVVVFCRRKELFLQNLKILNISQKNNFVFPKYITTRFIDLEYYLTNKIDRN